MRNMANSRGTRKAAGGTGTPSSRSASSARKGGAVSARQENGGGRKKKKMSANSGPLNGVMADAAIPRARIEALLYGYRYITLAAVLATGAALVSAGIAAAVLLRDNTIERYFATDPEGRITKLVPLDQPFLTPRAIVQFAERAVTSLLTFDGVNYKRQFAAARPWFTEDAIRQIETELARNGMLEEVIKTRAIVTTIGEGTPIIKAEGVDPQKGVYAWEIQLQLRMTVQTRRQAADGRYVALVRVERRKQTDAGQGVMITRIILKRNT